MENTENLTYTKAIEELERIIASIRSENCDVDTLAERTRRAATLLAFCRSRLTATEEELEKILADFD
ncbi:MAG: exodeoxyribonuclease VII small subunit [Muribaculaceae bacterium]|nr:exodeoxyribonuclease VII small subunit [Muribaculaceae bacterium]